MFIGKLGSFGSYKMGSAGRGDSDATDGSVHRLPRRFDTPLRAGTR
jgi:hypothetical protein